ncbi:hypothetical protein LSH36_41g13124 [Paralvinella palmiformis]|uniref:Uncharacterized protein n=1 Tax=Paralvinella palmiformis TaxID=53620 RepID=A0AAD9K7J1_9ANNE|nr:hypothetical protein LSH36_41g13124 [Paralvinella palmiformis]
MAAPMKIMRAGGIGIFRPFIRSFGSPRLVQSRLLCCHVTQQRQGGVTEGWRTNAHAGTVCTLKCCKFHTSAVTTAEAEAESNEEYHSIIKDTERSKGQ